MVFSGFTRFFMKIYSYIHIDKKSPLPIYQQLIRALESFCRDSSAGTAIPSERELSEQLSISRTILRKALKECVENGILVKSWGKGIFVAEKPRKRVLVIGVASYDYTNPGIYIMPGVEKRAQELEVTLERIPTNFLYNKEESFVTALLEREKFSGILITDYCCGFEEGALAALRKTAIPIYWPHMGLNGALTSPFHCGYIDSRKAFCSALTSLRDAGCRRIATLTVPRKHSEFLRGYTQEEFQRLQESLGLEWDPALIFSSSHDPGEIARVLDSFFEKGSTPFDGLLCFSDFFAIHAMDHLKRKGIRIPEEVAVMGYCGYPGGEFMDPPLSTVDYHYFRIGYEALDKLFLLAETRPADVQKFEGCFTNTMRGTLPAAMKGKMVCA